MRKIKIKKDKFKLKDLFEASIKLSDNYPGFCLILDKDKKYIADVKSFKDIETNLKKGNSVYIPFSDPFVEGDDSEEVACIDGKKLSIPTEDPSYYGEDTAGYVITLKDDNYEFESYCTSAGIICEMPPDLLPYSSKYLDKRMEDFLKKLTKESNEKEER